MIRVVLDTGLYPTIPVQRASARSSLPPALAGGSNSAFFSPQRASARLLAFGFSLFSNYWTESNVVVSSFLRRAGVPGKIRPAWEADLFELCFSRPLLLELQAVLNRPAIRRTVQVQPEEIAAFLDTVVKIAHFTAKPLPIESVVAGDPADDLVLATAVATGADLVVSGDAHLLGIKIHRRIPIITPRQFLEILEESRET